MKPTLYCALFSPPSRACLITAKLIGLDMNTKFVDFSQKEHLSEEFLKLNPQHTIPVLIDDGQPLWDSHSIMTYLVSKYAENDSLYPKDLVKRAKVDQRMYFECGILFPAIKDFVTRIVYEGEADYNPKSIQQAHKGYEFLEKFLENDYVAGNTMTIADVSNQTTIISLRKVVPIEEKRYPRITAWLKRMECLPDNEQINENGAEKLYFKIKSHLEENKEKEKNN